jgi:putative DNA primase/helicase
MIAAAEISRALADRITALAPELLPGGHREGNEWRAGSIAGEAGSSLGVHLTGPKAGIWCDFATGEKGDALDLVRAVLGVDMPAAIAWARRWLGIEDGNTALPARLVSAPKSREPKNPDDWRPPWREARPITGTVAETYLAGRGLRFDDLEGRVLRFHPRRARKNAAGRFENRPALLCALSDAKTGEQSGLINIYLQPDGSDRLRDSKGKTCTGRASSAVVTLSDFDEPAVGLVLCEGVETGIAIFQDELRPIWACGGAGTLRTFPVLGGIEALSIAADADGPGQHAAEAVAQRWRKAKREAFIIAPPAGDWADPR